MFFIVYCPSANWYAVDSECVYVGAATSWPLARSHCISIGSRLVEPHQHQLLQPNYAASTFAIALRHFMIRIGSAALFHSPIS